jgi:hypothetical protein
MHHVAQVILAELSLSKSGLCLCGDETQGAQITAIDRRAKNSGHQIQKLAYRWVPMCTTQALKG